MLWTGCACRDQGWRDSCGGRVFGGVLRVVFFMIFYPRSTRAWGNWHWHPPPPFVSPPPPPSSHTNQAEYHNRDAVVDFQEQVTREEWGPLVLQVGVQSVIIAQMMKQRWFCLNGFNNFTTSSILNFHNHSLFNMNVIELSWSCAIEIHPHYGSGPQTKHWNIPEAGRNWVSLAIALICHHSLLVSVK